MQQQLPVSSHGGCGSSSLRECIELLNNTIRKAPAALHSGIENEESPDPPQVMSPNMKEEQVIADAPTSGSLPSKPSLAKDEPQPRTSQVKSEVTSPKVEPPTLDVKEELSESVVKDQHPEQETKEENPCPDSEDCIDAGRVADELRRLTETQAPQASETPQHDPNRGATAPDSTRDRDRENRGPYAPQRSGRYRGRLQSPDPYMFNSTIWVEHDHEASARAHDAPMTQLCDRVRAVEHNSDTLRTRLTQVADLRDAQGIREDHRAIVARLNEVENVRQCIPSVNSCQKY